ncbi:flagellin D [Aurantimonas sp. 22II-16-19i]|nr:flagellin D [Aurantimonas sp. 22II-16-19i]
MTGLRALVATHDLIETTHSRVSTGLRVSAAKDSAAYWSIASKMRSDVTSLAAVQDALGIGSALIATAYAGMAAAEEVVSRIKSLLVSAKDPNVDRAKIQSEIGQAQSGLISIAKSASFAGVNWLETGIENMHEAEDEFRVSSIPASISRGADGRPDLAMLGVDISTVSLFNSDGGGILQADKRSPKTIGGLRYVSSSTETGYTVNGPNRYGWPAQQTFGFDGSVTFGAGDTMSFTVTVGAENASDPDLPPPYSAGYDIDVFIDRSLVDSVLPTANGTISTPQELAQVIRASIPGDPVSVGYRDYTYSSGYEEKYVSFTDPQLWSGSEGASMAVSNFTTTTSTTGGLANSSMSYGVTASHLSLSFEPFRVHPGVVVGFEFSAYGQTRTYAITRDVVERALGTDDGIVHTSEDMVKVLQSIMGSFPNLIIETVGSGLQFAIDRSADRNSAWGTGISVSSVDVNIEPLNDIGILDVDVAINPDMIDRYQQIVDKMHEQIITAASNLGAASNRIDMQKTFIDSLSTTMNRGIGHLIDANLEEEATRMKALQTQEMLGIQALSISNASGEMIAQLFKL